MEQPPLKINGTDPKSGKYLSNSYTYDNFFLIIKAGKRETETKSLCKFTLCVVTHNEEATQNSALLPVVQRVLASHAPQLLETASER